MNIRDSSTGVRVTQEEVLMPEAVWGYTVKTLSNAHRKAGETESEGA